MNKDDEAIRVDIDLAVEGYNSISGNEKINKTQLPKILGVSSRTISSWQKGESISAITKLNELIKLSGLRYEDLVKPIK